MTVQEIKTAVDEGKKVHWSNFAYTIVKSKSDYLIKHSNGNCIGLTGADDKLNGYEEDFFIFPRPAPKMIKLYETDGRFAGFNLIKDKTEIQIGRSRITPNTFYIKKYEGVAEIVNTVFYCNNWGQAYTIAKSFIN